MRSNRIRVRAGEIRSSTVQLVTANARSAWSQRHGRLLIATDDAGQRGLGEAAPLPGYSPDSLDEVDRALHGWIERLPIELELEAPLAAVRNELESLPIGLPSARFAVECSLLDLIGQRLDRSVVELLGQKAKCLPLAAVLSPSESIGDDLASLREQVESGIRAVKIKVGVRGRWPEELEVLDAVRDAFGDDLELRLDANGMLDAEHIEGQMRELADYQPRWIEEPLPRSDVAELDGSPIGIALDESLKASIDPQALALDLDAPWLSAVILKPAVLGGLLACRDLARAASSSGLIPVLSHLFDGPVALQASASLALALARDGSAAHGLARHAGLALWPDLDAPLVGKSTIDAAAASAGLGIGAP